MACLRIVVTYPGLSMESKAKKYNISSHYILSVGTLQPRKNYVRLIEALQNLRKMAKIRKPSCDNREERLAV